MLPSIGRALDFSRDNLQWVITAYAVSFGGFLLLGGRAADLLGRRRVFIAGLTLFTLASLVCGLAWSEGVLIGARAAQNDEEKDREGDPDLVSTEGTVDGGICRFQAAHFEWLLKIGEGLGLTLVRGCAEAHGGSIEVESTENGTTFTLRLPWDSRPYQRVSTAELLATSD